jgi:hypothetical protein
MDIVISFDKSSGLTSYSRRVFDVRNIIANFQMIMRLAGEFNEDVLSSITSKVSLREVDEGVLTRDHIFSIGYRNSVWETIRKDLSENDRLLNAIVQLRILTLNPLSIYRASTTSRDKEYIAQLETVKGTMYLDGFTETAKAIIYEDFGEARDYIGEGFETQDPSCRYAENDFPDGGLFNISKEFLFYGFPIMGIYPNMARMHTMEKAGLYAIPADPNLDYRTICIKWGIPLVDYITTDRMNTMKKVILDDTPIPPYLIVKRHPNLFHDAPWASATATRLRGLNLGLPWIMKMEDRFSSFNDDGFVNFFFSSNPTKEFHFLLPTSRTLGSLNRQLQTMWKRKFGETADLILKKYSNNIYSVEVGDIVQWIQFRAMVRKLLL